MPRLTDQREADAGEAQRSVTAITPALEIGLAFDSHSTELTLGQRAAIFVG